ncbi:hypothetical protein HDU67_007791 [Dinochytrium kinnereticum]|nr:hypothetical protein HDU67_007791 [Dinochytrium kinnereticum]
MHVFTSTAILAALTVLVSGQTAPRTPTNNQRVFIDYTRQVQTLNDCRKYAYQQTNVRCIDTYWNFGGMDTVKECIRASLEAYGLCEDAVLNKEAPSPKYYKLTYTPSFYTSEAWKTANINPATLSTPPAPPAIPEPSAPEEPPSAVQAPGDKQRFDGMSDWMGGVQRGEDGEPIFGEDGGRPMRANLFGGSESVLRSFDERTSRSRTMREY